MKYFATFTVAVTFLFLCLDGYHNGVAIAWQGSSNFYGEPPNINWAHGWPCYFMVRSSIYPKSAGKGGPLPRTISGDYGYYSRWPFDEAPVAVFSGAALLVDIAVFLVLLAGTWLGAREMSRLLNIRRFHFSLKALFALITVIAVLLTFRVPSLLPRHAVQFAAFTVVGVGAITAIGGFSTALARVVWGRN